MLTLVPFWLLAMVVIWFPVRLFLDVPWGSLPIAWRVLGAVLFIPSGDPQDLPDAVESYSPQDGDLVVPDQRLVPGPPRGRGGAETGGEMRLSGPGAGLSRPSAP